MGDLADWDAAELALAAALDNSGAAWVRNDGDGAFYGPKIDVTITGNTSEPFLDVLLLVDIDAQMHSAATTNVEPSNWIFSCRESLGWSTLALMAPVKRQ